MISLFRKRAETNIILELEKNYILDSVVDDFKNELLFPGNISVTINGLSEEILSTWILTNTETHKEIGSFTGNQTIERLTVGEYEVKFNSVPQYLTPPPQKRILSERQTLSIIGNYIRNLGDLNIRIDSNLKTFDNTFANWSMSGLNVDYFKEGIGELLVDNLEVGNYNIIFNPIEGFETPDSSIESVEPNKTKDVLGLYNVLCVTGTITGTTGGDIIITTNQTLPNAFVGEFYHIPKVQFNATGGVLPYRWYLNQNSIPLPSGLTLGIDGVLSGTPTTSTGNEYTLFVIDVHDSIDTVKSKTFRIKVAFAP